MEELRGTNKEYKINDVVKYDNRIYVIADIIDNVIKLSVTKGKEDKFLIVSGVYLQISIEIFESENGKIIGTLEELK